MPSIDRRRKNRRSPIPQRHLFGLCRFPLFLSAGVRDAWDGCAGGGGGAETVTFLLARPKPPKRRPGWLPFPFFFFLLRLPASAFRKPERAIEASADAQRRRPAPSRAQPRPSAPDRKRIEAWGRSLKKGRCLRKKTKKRRMRRRTSAGKGQNKKSLRKTTWVFFLLCNRISGKTLVRMREEPGVET